MNKSILFFSFFISFFAFFLCACFIHVIFAFIYCFFVAVVFCVAYLDKICAIAAQELATSVENVTDGKTVTDGKNAVQSEDTGASEPTVESLSKKYGVQAKAYVGVYNLNSGQDVDRFDSAFALAYDMGKSGVPFDYVKKSAGIGNDLTDTQKELAYNAGKESADVEARNNYLRNVLQSDKKGGTINENDTNGGIYGDYVAGHIVGDFLSKTNEVFHNFDEYIKELSEIHEQFKKENTSSKSEAKKAVRRRGFVKSEGVKLSELKKAFNDTQNKAYKILDTIARVTGINIVLYKSDVDADGNFIGKQGKFKWSNDTIYIDINAGLENNYDVGDLAKYTMLRTFSHEFSHFIEKWNPIQYNELRRAIFSELTARGADVDELITNKLAEDSTGEMTYEEASREVVAEALTDILPDSSFIETLANKHKNVFNKLLSKLKEFIADIKAYFKDLAKNKSDEANKLKEEMNGALHYAESIVKLFDKAAVDAVENYQAATPKADTDGKVQNQERYTEKKISYDEYSDEDYYSNGGIYSYDFLVAQKAMVKVLLPQTSALNDSNGKIDDKKVLSDGIKNALSEGVERDGKVYVKNAYTGRELRIDNSTIKHGLDGTYSRHLTNARIGAVVGSVVKNAIPINGLKNTSKTANGTYAMVSYCYDNNGRQFIAVITVEQHTGNVDSFELHDVAHAVSGRQKKGSQVDTKSPGVYPIEATDISIAQLLEIVNTTHQSILSDDVLAHLGETRNSNGSYSDKVLFRERTRTLTVGDFIKMADSGELDIELTDAEKDFIRIYKKKVDEFNSLKDQSEKLGKLYSEQQFGKDGKKPNRDEAVKTLNHKKIIDGKVEKASLEIMKMQDSAKVLPTLLEKTKKAAATKERAKNAEKRKQYFERKNKTEVLKTPALI